MCIRIRKELEQKLSNMGDSFSSFTETKAPQKIASINVLSKGAKGGGGYLNLLNSGIEITI